MGAGPLHILCKSSSRTYARLLSGALLTLAIVIGELTLASFLARPAFGPYLVAVGQSKAYEPAAFA